MWVTSATFLLYFYATLLKIEFVSTAVYPVKNISDFHFVVFIGARLTHINDVGEPEIVREVVGIGAVVGRKEIITTEEYLRWSDRPNTEYFVLLGTHDFDSGGKEIAILKNSVRTNIPQNDTAGPHSLVLLAFTEDLYTIPGVYRASLDNRFVISGYIAASVGIYEKFDKIELGGTIEPVLANAECKKLLKVPDKDKRYGNLGSHLCVEMASLDRIDCKSHIGTLLYYKVNPVNYLIGIKSQIHQSCSRIPPIMEIQRVSTVHDWLINKVTQ